MFETFSIIHNCILYVKDTTLKYVLHLKIKLPLKNYTFFKITTLNGYTPFLNDFGINDYKKSFKKIIKIIAILLH